MIQTYKIAEGLELSVGDTANDIFLHATSPSGACGAIRISDIEMPVVRQAFRQWAHHMTHIAWDWKFHVRQFLSSMCDDTLDDLQSEREDQLLPSFNNEIVTIINSPAADKLAIAVHREGTGLIVTTGTLRRVVVSQRQLIMANVKMPALRHYVTDFGLTIVIGDTRIEADKWLGT